VTPNIRFSQNNPQGAQQMNPSGSDPAADFTAAAVAVINSVENVRGGFASRHVWSLLANAACRAGDPSRPQSHNHGQCRISTGRKIAEALLTILSEVQFHGPVPSERITASLVELHKVCRVESALRRELGQR
jgi:hypothetical protein